MESTETASLKAGIRPENLRIRSGCEVRVELSVTEEEIIEFLSEVGEVWIRSFSNGAGINRLVVFPDEGSDWRHTGVITETAGLLFESSQWRNVWAVQRNDASGSKSFFLDVAGREGLVQQFELTPRSKFEAFQNLVTQNQTGGNLSANGESTSGSGFLEFIEERWRKTLSPGNGARRVDRTAVPDFILQLVRANAAFRITILNSAVKQTANVRISKCRVLGSEIMLEDADFLFEWDNACVDEAWMVQCGCNCGDEILELYDPHKRLVASMALQGLPPLHLTFITCVKLDMHHYEPDSRDTIFSCPGEYGQEVYLCGEFTSDSERLPMEWQNGKWQVRVALPAGMYAYQFEIDGQRTRDKTVQGTVNPAHSRSRRGCWSLAVVPNWLRPTVA